MILIFILSGTLLLLGLWEKNRLRNAQTDAILRIQVNGIRGKSTLVRMLTDLLTAAGKKVSARVSGEEPEIFDEGNGWKVFPRRGAARIKEISQFMQMAAEQKPDVLICENMALQAEYQHVFSKIVSPQISVYTNLRIDHQEVMGKHKAKIAETLSFSLSETRTVLFFDDADLRKEFQKQAKNSVHLKILSESHGTADDDNNTPFRFHFRLLDEIGEQLAIDPSVVEEIRSHWQSKLSPGNFVQAISIGERTADFINLFTCNDVESTKEMLNFILSENEADKKIALLLACRADRPLRTLAFLDWLAREVFWQKLLLFGSAPYWAVRKRLKRMSVAQQVVRVGNKNCRQKLRELAAENDVIIGMGNYVNSGERIERMIQEINDGN